LGFERAIYASKHELKFIEMVRLTKETQQPLPPTQNCLGL
jgi:hypothetical protein